MVIKDYVQDIAAHIKDGRVLDAGCCASTPKNLLIRHNVYKKAAGEIIGVDINRNLLKEAIEERNAENLHYCDVTNNTDVDSIIERFGTFDHVIATDIIEHIGNLTLFLDNLHKLLDKNGKLYLTTPNAMCPKFILWCVENGGETKVNPDHVCFFDTKTLVILLKRSKFKVKKLMFQNVGSEAAAMLNLKPQPWMGKRIYVIATKE